MTWKRSFIHLLLALSIGCNMWLGQRVVKLDRMVDGLTARPRLQVGNQLPNLDLVTAAGAEVQLRYSDSQLPTVIYILSPTCGWCVKNTRSVSQLADALNERARFVGISIGAKPSASAGADPTPLVSTALPFPVFMGITDAMGKQLKLRSTPTTVVVSPHGQVLAVWEGAYSGSTKEELEDYFSVTLPELEGSSL